MNEITESDRTAQSHLENWAKVHQEEIREITEQIQKSTTKAIVIVGSVHSGKTTLALSIAREMQKNGTDTHFTTPAIQNTFGAKSILDRTGARFSRLPHASDIEQNGRPTLIVIDETSQREPRTEGQWSEYAKANKTKFIILTNPHSATLNKWTSLFKPQQIVVYHLR